MSTENSQFDLSGIQLRESRTQPKVSLSREIGEAQIVHTIFGRAKVRIIRKNDKLYRTMWLMAAGVVTVIGVVVWQGWYAAQQTEAVQDADRAGVESAQQQAGEPSPISAEIAAPANLPPANIEAVTPPPVANHVPAADQKSAPQQPAGLKEAEQKVVKPVTVQPKPVAIKPKPVEPLTESKPQTAPATVTSTPKNQTDQPLPTVVTPTKRPVAPVVAPQRTTQSAASSPAAVVPVVSPVDTGDTSPQSPVDEKQLSDPINMQSN